MKQKTVSSPTVNHAILQSDAHWDQYVEKQAYFRQLTIKEQLDALQKETQEYDKVIGEIYIQNPPGFSDRNQLNGLLKNAKLIEEFSVIGQGDTEINLIFSVNNLFIGVTYFAFWRGSFSMNKVCKVYRALKNPSGKSPDMNKIKKALFGY